MGVKLFSVYCRMWSVGKVTSLPFLFTTLAAGGAFKIQTSALAMKYAAGKQASEWSIVLSNL
ncbi:hypothetical protein L483_13325 [Pseudomonas putida H8234]|nr:hypothetical protein L483_13325 [Pseudomonas putida H8234]